jgi:1,4-dihydroxy-6-naphthoate synthase
MTTQTKQIVFGHSPDADDAFMYYALAKGHVRIPGHEVSHRLEDIQSLNVRAANGELEVTAISAAVYPKVARHYRIMSCGASVGRNYGPVVVSKAPMTAAQLTGKRIGVPGEHTTSWMLFRIFVTGPVIPVFLDFDAVGPAVLDGSVDAGILLHEGQILYRRQGFSGVLDLGEKWSETTKLPIPLGLDCVHRRLGDGLAQAVTDALQASVVYARSHEDDALDYALAFGRGIAREDARRFVRMYVNDDTVDMGDEGRRALAMLYSMAAGRGIISAVPELDIIQGR